MRRDGDALKASGPGGILRIWDAWSYSQVPEATRIRTAQDRSLQAHDKEKGQGHDRILQAQGKEKERRKEQTY